MFNRRLLSKKNVVGYGTGIKRVGGKKTGEEATLVFVTKKTSDISESDRIPANIGSLVTDVIEIGEVRQLLLPPCSSEVRHKTITPLRGGQAIGCSSLSGTGTLGAIVKQSGTERLVAITNGHVAGNMLTVEDSASQSLRDAGIEFTRCYSGKPHRLEYPQWIEITEHIYQSNNIDGNLTGDVIQASIRGFLHPCLTDTAIATIRSEIGVTPGIMGLTKYPQTFTHPNNLSPGDEIIKSGATTGTTTGELVSTDIVVGVSIGSYMVVYEEQMCVESTGSRFADHGDSGSMLCVDKGNGRVGIVGQLHSGTDDGQFTFGSRMDRIVNEFNIAPWDGRIITPARFPNIVSTGGSVYSADETTFLSTTNDYVCDGEDCRNPSLVVTRTEIQLTSFAHLFPGEPIVLRTTNLNVAGVCEVEVGLDAELDCNCAGYIESDVFLRISCDSALTENLIADASIPVEFYIAPEISAEVFPRLTAHVDRDVMLGISSYIPTSRGCIAEVTPQVLLAARLTSQANVVDNYESVTDCAVRIAIAPSISAVQKLQTFTESQVGINITPDICSNGVFPADNMSSVSLSVDLDCQCIYAQNADVSTEVRLRAVALSGAGVTGKTGADLYAEVILAVDCISSVDAVMNYLAWCDAEVGIDVNADSGAWVPDIDTGSGSAGVAECDGVDIETIGYGVAL